MMRVRQAQLSMKSNCGFDMATTSDYDMSRKNSGASVDELIHSGRLVQTETTPAAHSHNKSLLIDDHALSDVSDEELSYDTPQSGRKANALSSNHKLTLPGLPAILKSPVAAVHLASSVSPSHSFRTDAAALPLLAGAAVSESHQDHNDLMTGRSPREEVVRRRSCKPGYDVAARTTSKSSIGDSLPVSRSVSLDIAERRSNTKSRRESSKESSFRAYRTRMRTQTIDAVVESKEIEYKSNDISEARLARKHGIDALDVHRLLRQFYKALAGDAHARGGCLSVPAIQSLIRTLFHLPVDRDLPVHLVEADWSSASEDCRVGPEGFIAWWKNHQWCEEIMVPDPDERKVRQFCREQGYDLLDVERVKAAFDRADQDDSGMLEQAEFRAAVASLQNSDAVAINDTTFLKLWKEVDADGSGTIELLEFAKWYLENS